VAHLPNGAWLSDANERQNQATVSEHKAELQKMLEQAPTPVTEEWNRILYQIDPQLRMVRAQESACAPGIVPGYYHVLRKNDIGPPTPIPLAGHDNEFLEPGSWVLEMLQRSDMWSNSAQRERDRVAQELERQRRRAQENEKEERRDEISERWKAASNPGVSFANQGSGWRYRAGAPRAA
jgi:hypothetical protein